MAFTQIVQALSAFTARVIPAAKPARPLEIDLDLPTRLSPAERAAIGTWITEDGAMRLELRRDGRFDKTRPAEQVRYRGRYEVDDNRLYFEGDSGTVALGQLRRGVLDIGEKRFRKAA